jgi:hypothetical protein
MGILGNRAGELPRLPSVFSVASCGDKDWMSHGMIPAPLRFLRYLLWDEKGGFQDRWHTLTIHVSDLV